MGELRIKLKESFQVLDYSAYWATLLVKFQPSVSESFRVPC